jgi:hypothetical protein
LSSLGGWKLWFFIKRCYPSVLFFLECKVTGKDRGTHINKKLMWQKDKMELIGQCLFHVLEERILDFESQKLWA